MATLLVVDDEANIRGHLATYLSGLGHRVHTAADAAEALRTAEREAIELVLPDVRMAGMDGLALLRELRRRRPDAIVILMTAYATVAGAVAAMKEGAFHYVVKPFALDEVGMLVERALELGTLRRASGALPLLESKSAACAARSSWRAGCGVRARPRSARAARQERARARDPD